MNPRSPLARYDLVLLDLDGCVWVGDEETPRAAEAIAALRRASKRVGFVTNDARGATDGFVRKLWGLGVQASAREVVTVGGALQHRLAEDFAGAAAVVIGAPALHRHVRDAGLRIVNGTPAAAHAAVVVVGGHEGFHYDELRDAGQAALAGAALLASERDRSFPMPDGLWPGTGAILAAVETMSGREAETVGKPGAGLIHTALDRLGPGRAIMIGDRVDADVLAAHAAGIDAAVVLTGVSDRAAALRAPAPGVIAVAGSLGDLVLGDP